ncbi:MAG: hypothetical protein KGY42_00590 [Desulfobacterales bacterium]|nr:hypothetical protein [Desulfobacterales bacterium]MBS3756080.1 hypothetical protein [Desulfobacterales bacterium]
MKQKYAISKDEKTGDLSIQEYAELSKDMFSLVCEESYKKDRIEKAIDEGRNALINTLRTPNLYPISDYIEKIADTITDFYQAKGGQNGPIELVFDDIELFRREEESASEEEEGSVKIDDLLDDDSAEEDSSKKKEE